MSFSHQVDPKKRPYPIDGTWERYTFLRGSARPGRHRALKNNRTKIKFRL
jgi:hypothetical protein